jgi:hypothetical protein
VAVLRTVLLFEDLVELSEVHALMAARNETLDGILHNKIPLEDNFGLVPF